ncbi:hypothetical protein CBL_11574 [Carabus blaptoides fortunei]
MDDVNPYEQSNMVFCQMSLSTGTGPEYYQLSLRGVWSYSSDTHPTSQLNRGFFPFCASPFLGFLGCLETIFSSNFPMVFKREIERYAEGFDESLPRLWIVVKVENFHVAGI